VTTPPPARSPWPGDSPPRVLLCALAAALAPLVRVARAAADHPGGLRSESLGPVAAALVFGGLALVVGMMVVVIVSLFTRRSAPPDSPPE
jgi:hypothetical protein